MRDPRKVLDLAASRRWLVGVALLAAAGCEPRPEHSSGEAELRPEGLDAGTPPAAVEAPAANPVEEPSIASRGTARGVSARWVVDSAAGFGPVRRLQIEYDPPGREFVRALCIDGDHLAAATNGITGRTPEGRFRLGLFILAERELAPCELELDPSGHVACFDGTTTRAGPCEPPLVPTAPPDGKASTYGIRIHRDRHLLAEQAEVLRVHGRVVLGRSYELNQVSAVWRSRCGPLASEKEVHFSYARPRAGEAWSLDAVLHQPNREPRLPGPCSVRLALRVRRPGTVHEHDEEPLGVWCLTSSGARPGGCTP